MPTLKQRTNNPDALVSHLSWSVLWLLLVCGVICSCSTTRKQPTQKWVKKYPKQAQKILNDFRYVDSGRLTMGFGNNILTTESDSTLLVSNYEHTENVPAFYISDHEVTNAEYREFTNWVRDSIALSLIAQADPSFYLDKEKKILDWGRLMDLSKPNYKFYWDRLYLTESESYFRRNQINTRKLIYKYYSGFDTISTPIYPDTLIWLENGLTFSYSPQQYYLSHPAYDNYPVVGITFGQANAYCHWKSERVNEILLKQKLQPKKIRLPTEAEWEMAASGLTPEGLERKIYTWNILPWKGFELHTGEGKYYANFGNIVDQNGWSLKWFDDDGETYTSKAKSYPANKLELYDVAGNVAEWTLDMPQNTKFMNCDFCGKHSYGIKIGEYYHAINWYYTEAWNKLQDSTRKKVIDSFSVMAADDLHSAIQKVLGMEQFFSEVMRTSLGLPNSFYDYNLKAIEAIAAAELHDAKVLAAHNNLRIVKGGSWATGPAYMLCSSREVFPENKCSSRIGFRLVMDK